MRVIGLMSGTSMDGVDIALLETDGEAIHAFGPTGYRPYADDERAAIRAALAVAPGLSDRHARPEPMRVAEVAVTDTHEEAIRAFLDDHAIDPGDIDAIGFHGQTVFHAPDRALTVQIGDGAALADRLGMTVVHDFRAEDMRRGGQGAPLVPIYHRALAGHAGLAAPLAIVNIGGVANVTILRGDGDPIAFDTGPGNALIDDWVERHTGARFDEGGALARSGRVDAARLAALLSHDFFSKPYPKSLDRNDFELSHLDGLSVPDGAATLVAFTAESLARSLDMVAPDGVGTVVIAGGGARNPAIVASLADRVAARVVTMDDIGLSADAVEAQAFAYLAARRLRDLPATFPTTTGVAAPVIGGEIALSGKAA